MSLAAYDSCSPQQCGLLNGGMNPAASPNSIQSTSKLTKFVRKIIESFIILLGGNILQTLSVYEKKTFS